MTSLFSSLLETGPYPDELLNLYNPAYVGSIIYLGGRAFQQKTKRPFPIFFPYLMFPLIAIDKYRERLPVRVGKLYEWGRQNGDVLFDYPTSVLALKPFVSSGLVFIKKHRLIEFDSELVGFEFKANANLNKNIDTAIFSSLQVQNEVALAPVAGRLLASDADTSAVLALFGMKP